VEFFTSRGVEQSNVAVDRYEVEVMPEKIGEYIRKLRKGKNIGLRKLSRMMGSPDHTYLYQVEKDRTKPSDDFLEKLAKALNLTSQERTMLTFLTSTRKDELTEDLTPAEAELSELLEETGIVVGAFTGNLSEAEIKILIKRIKKWRRENEKS